MSPETVKVAARIGGAGEGAIRTGEVVLRALALADLAPGYDGPAVAVDKTRFPEVLRELSPRVSITVPDRLGSGVKEHRVDLVFADLKAFHPDAIARSVPLLAELLEARGVLASCLSGELDAAALPDKLPAAFASSQLGAAVRQAIAGKSVVSAAVAPTPGAATGGGVDSLLSMVEVPAGTAPAPQPAGLLDMLVQVVLPGAGKTAVDKDKIKAVLDELDSRLSRQVTAICEAKGVRDLEAAWRGLKLLVERVDFRKPILLEVLPVRKDELLDVFYERVFQTEHQGLAATPLSLVLADVAVDRGPADLELIETLGKMGASLGVPFLASLAPEFFGVKQAALLGSLPDLAKKVRGPEYAKWNRFRGDDASLWVALAVNRVLLRDAWGETSTEVHAFSWSKAAVGNASQPLFGSGSWALATVIMRAFGEAGLQLPITGVKSPGVLENLPLRAYKSGKAEPVPLPIEVLLGDSRTLDLAQSGLVPLVAQPGTDSAYFPAVPTFHQPARYDQEEATRASFRAATLSYQLFAGLAAHALDALARRASGTASEAEIVQHFQDGLLAFLASAEEGPKPEEIGVELAVNPENPQVLDVAVRLRPAFALGGGPADLMLGTQVIR